MEKSDVKVHDNHSDTSSVITMKEYAPSEYPSSEPPPAYMKPRSNALRIAKLAAFTVIVSSIILGGFILAASWIQANTARNLDLTLNQELLDDLHPSYEHLIANEVIPEQQHNSLDQVKSEGNEETQNKSEEKQNLQPNDEGLVPPPPPPLPGKMDEKKVLDLDEIANILMQKNMKGNVNCIVEKRRNEELVDHAPMTLNLPSVHMPFGFNITTPPRLQRVTGEQMIVICKDDDDEEKDSESEEETNDGNNNKVDEIQSIVFPLPNQLLSQIQRVPQIIPLSHILQHLPMQQQQVQMRPVQQIPIQQIRFHQVPVQQIPIQIREIPIQQIQVQNLPIQMKEIPVQQVQPQNIPIQVREIPIQQIQTQNVPFQIREIPIQQTVPLQVREMPIQQIFPQVQNAPVQMREIPIQQIPVNHINLPQFQPQQQQQQQQQPQVLFQQQVIPEQAPQQMTPPQRVMFPQRNIFPQAQLFNNQQNVQQEIIPLKDVVINENKIPVNHVFHHRMPINPMAVNDIPISRMPITHLPMENESPMKDEPVHHLLPPQAQQYQAENFRQEEPRFNEPQMPMFPPQALNQVKPFPVEVRDPGAIRMPKPMSQVPREQFEVPPPQPNQFFPRFENREPEFEDKRGFRQLTVDVRPRGQRREQPFANSLIREMPKIIPLNLIRRPMDGNKIRFPDVMNNDEIRENPLPIITEITKIIPIKLEKEEPEMSEPIHETSKIEEVPEIKLEKMPSKPFPIPINAILDMIFRGIRPLMNREHPFPIPIDIKIERIDSKPLNFMTPPFLKKIEILKKEADTSAEEETDSAAENKDNSEENDKDIVEAKVERVEVFDRENENSHPIPIPAEAREPQVFKMEDDHEKDADMSEPEQAFANQAFLPNGQGRGARVFQIPQGIREAEIFSVFDAKADKNAETEVPVESSVSVMNPERENAPEAQDEQQKGDEMPSFFPDEKKVQSFVAPESRSLKLFPVPTGEVKTEDVKAPMSDAEMEEARPHFVQPRSV